MEGLRTSEQAGHEDDLEPSWVRIWPEVLRYLESLIKVADNLPTTEAALAHDFHYTCVGSHQTSESPGIRTFYKQIAFNVPLTVEQEERISRGQNIIKGIVKELLEVVLREHYERFPGDMTDSECGKARGKAKSVLMKLRTLVAMCEE